MAGGIRLIGFKKFGDKLKLLGDKVQSNDVLKVLREGADIVAAEMKNEAPIDDGDLRDSIKPVTLTARPGKPLAAGVIIGPHPNDVEFGAGRKASRVWRAVNFGNAAGVAPNPFRDRGVKSGRKKARKVVAAGVERILKKAV